MLSFIPGIELSRRFYHEAVAPELRGQPHATALIGPGSDVLGYDTEQSMDHDWGPRVLLFLPEDGFEEGVKALRARLDEALPDVFLGHPVARPSEGQDAAFQNVPIHTVHGFFRQVVGADPAGDLTAADWLTFPEQDLLSLTSGAVHHDGIGLEEMRERFAYWPQDIWLYRLASAWQRIGQEEHLMGRAGMVGDELGAAVIAGRLVRDVMHICFLINRRYAPYAKWLGTAFQELPEAEQITPLLQSALAAQEASSREAALMQALSIAADHTNELGLAEPQPTNPEPFYDRPYTAIKGERFAQALSAAINDPEVIALAERGLIGGLDQFSDSVDLVSHTRWRSQIRSLLR